jgi:hypothetical protein
MNVCHLCLILTLPFYCWNEYLIYALVVKKFEDFSLKVFKNKNVRTLIKS